ncbi:ADP-ribosylation factor-like protein 14 isoform X2 [Zootoca vivipara]|uniref:ADP-ribosylation factor-like protein 14 isoform X2 n=1 Tax=Zootoca vivipara TaxID=8524 RepID=UPI00293BB866|nr:ADP-ribosylation factor-like protein 14 isoform X2 [Zootoca vivipara]
MSYPTPTPKDHCEQHKTPFPIFPTPTSPFLPPASPKVPPARFCFPGPDPAHSSRSAAKPRWQSRLLSGLRWLHGERRKRRKRVRHVQILGERPLCLQAGFPDRKSRSFSPSSLLLPAGLDPLILRFPDPLDHLTTQIAVCPTPGLDLTSDVPRTSLAFCFFFLCSLEKQR